MPSLSGFGPLSLTAAITDPPAVPKVSWTITGADDVKGNANVGGVAGENKDTITACYNTGSGLF
ncbi:hypothetical protein AGMMS49940_05630 [Spirochaetia bacterium]|nr:hypothetical protein AGMMS49940_05630 [Spirochaetia bacterium]